MRPDFPFEVKPSWVWRMAGPVLIAVAAAYPVLVTFIEMRRLGRGDLLAPLGILAFGLWFWWRYWQSVVASETGLTFRSLFRSTSLRWEDVERVERSEDWLIVADRSGRRHRVSADAERADDLEERLRDRLDSGRRTG